MDEQDVNAGVNCMGCDKASPGPIYGCVACEFYLHKSCSEVPREIQNFFHPCPLVLSIVRCKCNACFQPCFGFSYGCKRCDFNMHVECAQRPIIESQGEELVHHFTHWHPLALVDQSNKDLEVHCRICDKLCSGSGGSTTSSAYGCEECNFYVHNSCMINIPRQMNHLFHPSCPLIPLICLPFTCRGCGDYDDSLLGFTCGECRFQLDFKCALLPTVESKDADKIQHSSHQHPLALRENREFGSEDQCIACEEHCLDSCYVCERCDLFLHRQCADAFEFRPKIHHPFHPLHPLSLSPLPPDSPDQAAVLCAACGGFNEKTLLVYQCVECDSYLHTHCAKQLLPSLKNSKDQSSMKGKDEENSSLEATIAKINNEIEELRSKEKPLEVETEKLRAMLEATEGDLLPIKKRLEELEKDRFLNVYELKHNMKENKHPTDQASTSDGLASHLS
ncbi:hypothetical protein PTKIN_Ptkin04bG0213700 [Pterospermum kingtungense]